ncbi:MAG TPA: copper resistance protein NlpE [Algoriphagus sp.]|nr:copper resistance protein NlpE [Algoriphagus sp.]
MRNFLLLLLSIVTLNFACNKPADKVAVEEVVSTPQTAEEIAPEAVTGATHHTGDNSQTSVDWPGTYFATLPCGHCEGIETWITLKSNGTYEYKTNYLGLNDAREEIFTGKFSWDAAGGIVVFEGLIGDYPGKFKVGENQIWYLDVEGKKIDGELADRYILKKK